jgi:hypothetical protein
MKNMKISKFWKMMLTTNLIASAFLYSCTDLEDKVTGRPVDASSGSSCVTAKGKPSESLGSAYARLNDLSDQANVYALLEHPSDEMMGPTRGTDWDDFGTWRKLHQHTWDATHNQIISSWDNLNNAVFRSQLTIYSSDPNSQKQIIAEASFLKAFYSFYIVDLFGKLPSTNLANTCAGATLLPRAQAVDTLIKDLNYSVTNLALGSPNKANKSAAQFLLAKVYLNKAVYTSDPENPAGPYSFAKADMDKVIELCNAIISSGSYELTKTGKYFDNFHWENGQRSKELIFTIENNEGSPIANVRNRYYMGLHYNQTPSGWNGFTTLADFYNSFEKADQRLGGAYPGVTDKIGLQVGFLVGQQYDAKGNKLKTRGGEDLIFTPDINIAAAGEEKGIRVMKYFPNPDNLDNSGADYVLFRYSDVLLMKAEAILRGGSDSQGQTALTIINGLRATRGASALGSVTLANVLAERGRELYYEGWRRQDQIRFESFLKAVDQRPNQSDKHVVVFPIPQKSIDLNPKWEQNKGY